MNDYKNTIDITQILQGDNFEAMNPESRQVIDTFKKGIAECRDIGPLPILLMLFGKAFEEFLEEMKKPETE